MKYALTPAQAVFKEALRQLLKREASVTEGVFPPDEELSAARIRKLEEGIRSIAEDVIVGEEKKLSGVASVLMLEEVTKRMPAWRPGLEAGGLFPGSCSELFRAASDIGMAQWLLAPFLRNLHPSEGGGPDGSRLFSRTLSQALADLLAEIESARLILYRAAILEDRRQKNPYESAKAEKLASDLAGKAAALAEEIEKGKIHET